MHDFKEIYVEIFHQCDILECLEKISHTLIADMGFDSRDIPAGMRFIDYLSQNVLGDALTYREIIYEFKQ